MHRTIHRFSPIHLILLCATLFVIALPSGVRAGERDPYSPREYTGPGVWPTTATLGNHLYFTWYSPLTGMELWKSDSTQQGTGLLMDVYPGSFSADPSQVHSVNNRLLFFADDGVHGRELWVSDGTTVGTKLLKDFYPGPKSGQLDSNTEIRSQVVGNRLFFVVETVLNQYELWVSDSTIAGTKLVRKMDDSLLFPIEMVSFKNKLYFTGTDSLLSINVWVSDGTPQGTQQLKTATTAEWANNSFVHLTPTTTALYMVRYPNNGPEELWTSDGTAVGTLMLHNNIGEPYSLTPVGTRIIFGTNINSSKELWTSDGTQAGTRRLRMIDVQSGEGIFYITQNPLATFAGVSYFRVATGSGFELWRSDGTDTGTRKFGAIGSDIALRGEYNEPVVPRSGGAFFEHGVRGQGIWYADDTTQQLRKLMSHAESVSTLFGATAQGLAIYTINDNQPVPSLWASNGTVAGTWQIVPYRAFAPAVMR